MARDSSLTVEVRDQKYDVDYFVELFRDVGPGHAQENFKELVLVASLRDSLRGVSLCERIKREINVASRVDMKNVLEDGGDRRTRCKLVFTLSRI